MTKAKDETPTEEAPAVVEEAPQLVNIRYRGEPSTTYTYNDAIIGGEVTLVTDGEGLVNITTDAEKRAAASFGFAAEG